MSQQEEFCKTHPKKTLSFYCLDGKCKKQPITCILCIKNDHNQCNDDLIVARSNAEDKILLKENETDPKTLTQKLNQILELKLYEMNKTLLG